MVSEDVKVDGEANHHKATHLNEIIIGITTHMNHNRAWDTLAIGVFLNTDMFVVCVLIVVIMIISVIMPNK